MLFEFKLGSLIRRLNPYTDGGMRSMECGASPPVIPANLPAALTAAAQAIQDYANHPNPNHLAAVNQAEDAVDAAMRPIDIDVEVDNDYQQEYMNWTFRGRPYAVKKAVLIKYRYELRNSAGPTGIFATDHILIGFAGANGG